VLLLPIVLAAYCLPLAQVMWVAGAVGMVAVLLGRLRNLMICCPFRVSWWAVSFPLAASAIAALRFAAAEPGQVTDVIALALLALATITIAGLLIRTLVGLARGELRTLTT